MKKISLDDFPEVFLSNKEISLFITRELKKGTVRKLGSRLYTKNLTDPIEQIIRRNIWTIISEYFPQALISDRSAIENNISSDGSIFIVSNKKRIVKLPGLIINSREGMGPLKNDKLFISGLYLSSTARGFLENMRPSRAKLGRVARTLSKKEIEEHLDYLLVHYSESAILSLRDEMRSLAPELHLEKEFHEIDQIIGKLLGTREAHLSSQVGKARAAGFPYDSKRISLFEDLIQTLIKTSPRFRPWQMQSQEAWNNLSFFESYFSNFIEGTEFEIEEAHDIIFSHKIPKNRPQDAHDVLGTYQIVNNYAEMKALSKNYDDFENLLKRRHATLMKSRVEKDPGQFKSIPNRAGNTLFVEPNLVRGTLKKGFELLKLLTDPFQRAVFMMFLISEVHPFLDGNGRIARIMMNAELVAANECRIIIPTVYRNTYLVSLRALTQNCKTDPLIKTLDFAQKYTQAINWLNYRISLSMLEKTHAFMDSSQAEYQGIHLTIPQF